MSDFYHYQAKVLKIVDGDTVDLEIDLGFGVFQRKRVRLFGINAPEMNTAEGQIAKIRLEAYMPVGAEVEMDSIKDKSDKYGRYLAILQYNNTVINDWLVMGGLAQPASY